SEIHSDQSERPFSPADGTDRRPGNFHRGKCSGTVFIKRSSNMSTAIIDYGAGNLRSVEEALLSLGETPVITGVPEEILSADRIILPGVGAFGDAMEHLRQRGLDQVIRQAAGENIPFLGICLGLQLLFE